MAAVRLAFFAESDRWRHPGDASHTMPDSESTELPEPGESAGAPGSGPDTQTVAQDALALVPTWLALTVLAGLLVLAGAVGYGLNSVTHRGDTSQRFKIAAVETWQSRVAKDPQDTLSRLGLANALTDAGQLDLAILEYEYVLQENPKDVAALYARGAALMKLGQPLDAESSFWAVLAQDPGHARAAEALGEYYASKKQYRSLVEAVRPAVTQHPTEARLQYLMGLAYENLGHPDWAITRYRLALDAVPDMPEALAGLARLGRSVSE